MGLFRGIGARRDATRGTSPIEVRKVLAGLFASTGGVGARSGILYNGSTAPLGTGDATWAYNVDLFHVYVSRSASDGGTVFGNDGSVLIGATGVGSTVPIAPGAGLSRIDIAWTRHPTAGENGDGATTVALASEPLFGVVSGVAASSNPVAPTIPAGGFELFRNLMTSAATSTLSVGNTITQSALYTAVRGAPVPCRNQAERDALPLFDGLRVYRLDLHLVEMYNSALGIWTGGAWIAYTPVLVGPALGTTGTLVGAYTKVGHTVNWRATAGTGGTGIFKGSGPYSLSMPVAAVAGPVYFITGYGWLYGGGVFKPVILDGTPSRLMLTASGAVMDGSVNGFADGVAGQALAVGGSYESAT